MEIETFVCNPIMENTFVVYDETKDCILIDPGCFTDAEFSKIDNFIKTEELKVVKIVNTHSHFDHIMGVQKCRTAYNVKWEAHYGDNALIENAPNQGKMFGIPMQKVALPDVELNEGDTVEFGTTKLEVLYVPGHSNGSICLYNKECKQIIVGDVLFRGSIGRTDLPGGNHDLLLSGIKSKLLQLPEDVVVYPGHGGITTIGEEKISNPFLL